MSLADTGFTVELHSPHPVERYIPSSTEGINAALDSRGEGDSTKVHFEETMAASAGKADADFAMRMCEHAPGILDLLMKLGLPFTRTSDAKLDFRVEPPSEYHRAAYAWNETGRQIHRVLCDQIRRLETSGRIIKREYFDVLDFVLDADGVCRGLVTLDLKSMDVAACAYDAVVLAVGGPLAAYGDHLGISDDFPPMISAYIRGAGWAEPHSIRWQSTPPKYMGGIFTDENFQTDISRLFAVGECARIGKAEGLLPGNELLRDIFCGLRCASSVNDFITKNQSLQMEPDTALFDKHCNDAKEKLLHIEPTPETNSAEPSNDKTLACIYDDLSAVMTRSAGLNRTLETLAEAQNILSSQIQPYLASLQPSDRTQYANRDIPIAHRLRMLIIACETIIRSASSELTAGCESPIIAGW